MKNKKTQTQMNKEIKRLEENKLNGRGKPRDYYL